MLPFLLTQGLPAATHPKGFGRFIAKPHLDLPPLGCELGHVLGLTDGTSVPATWQKVWKARVQRSLLACPLPSPGRACPGSPMVSGAGEAVEPDVPAELSLDQRKATHTRDRPAPSACVAEAAFGP